MKKYLCYLYVHESLVEVRLELGSADRAGDVEEELGDAETGLTLLRSTGHQCLTKYDIFQLQTRLFFKEK